MGRPDEQQQRGPTAIIPDNDFHFQHDYTARATANEPDTTLGEGRASRDRLSPDSTNHDSTNHDQTNHDQTNHDQTNSDWTNSDWTNGDWTNRSRASQD